MNSCCETPSHTHPKADKLFWGSLTIIVGGVAAYFFCDIFEISAPLIHHFGHSIISLLQAMWWGVLLGLFFVGLMGRVPKEYFTAMLGRGDTIGGIFRAAGAGLLLDLCSHGILMVGAKLYERGASLGQMMAFLIASPWNSLSLTLILISLIGLKWTLLFIAGSTVIAIVTGLAYQGLTRAGVFPANPNAVVLPDDFNLLADAKTRLKTFRPNGAFWSALFKGGWQDSQMVLRWLLFGVVLASP